MSRTSMATRRAFYRQAEAQLQNDKSEVEVLEDFIQRLARRRRKKAAAAMTVVLNNFRDGKPLSVAFGPSLGNTERAILKAGEEGGELDEAMRLILDVDDRVYRIGTQLIDSALSPLVYVLSLWLCLWVIGAMLVPDFSQMLPPERWTGWAYAMYVMGMIAAGWSGVVVVVIFISLCIAAGVSKDRWTGKGRVFFDSWIFPFTLFRSLNGFVWLMTFTALLRARVPDTTALQTQIAVSSPYMRSRLHPVLVRLLGGQKLDDALRNAGNEFPSPDLIDDIGAYVGYEDFPNRMQTVAIKFSEELERRIVVQSRVALGIFTVAMFAVMFIVQLGVNELQTQLMNTIQSL